jgi:hypothetical protein
VRPKQFLSLLYVWCKTVHLYCTDTNTVSKRTEMRFHMTHSTRSYVGCVQCDSEPIVHSTQTVHLSCVKITTISKWTQPSFHLSLVTMEYCRVRPKRFMSLLYLGVPHGVSKMIFDLVVHSTQTTHLSYVKVSTISKWTETIFHTTHSLRSSTGCVQDDFRSGGTFDTNCSPILRQG